MGIAMKKNILPAVRLLIVLTVITGVLYPLLISGAAAVCFPERAGGSLVKINGTIAGSELIAQNFTSAKYFHPRPSAVDFNPMPSGASNWSITADTLKKLFDLRAAGFRKENFIESNVEIPSEMLFASGSGVDPHISKDAALLQVNRVAESRAFTSGKKTELVQIINTLSRKTIFSILGEELINVLLLNIELDKLSSK